MQNESLKHVTNRLGVQVAHRANEKGISRENWVNFFNDPIKSERFFNQLKNEDNDWFEKLQTEASKIGARVHKGKGGLH